jgi:hypothetical protein
MREMMTAALQSGVTRGAAWGKVAAAGHQRGGGMRRWGLVAAIALIAAVLPGAPARAGHFSADGKSWCYGDDPHADAFCVPVHESGANRNFGAIAATASTGDYYGYSYGFGSRKEAEQKALAECNHAAGTPGACIIASWFHNECAALAQGRNGNWGADWADTQKLAESKALADCRDVDRSGTCHVVKAYCSN